MAEVTIKEETEPPPSLHEETEPPDWKIILSKSITRPSQLPEDIRTSGGGLEEVVKKYPMNVNPYYLGLIKEKGDAIYNQAIPSLEEITDSFGEEDPLHEEGHEGIPALITHRYPDRALFIVSNQCAMFCRHCTRKRKVGDSNRQPNSQQIKEGLEYISSHPKIRDVILSGGDPLMLSDKKLESIVSSVYDIMSARKDKYGNPGIIRIGTRIPVTLPQRITPELCDMLKKYHPLYINTHFNHPNEITPESRKACNMLADAGIPIGNQTVLLKGVNDNIETMRELVVGLIGMRVKPYYIYQCDPVKGVNHFRTTVEEGQEIYKGLRGYISGMAVPTLVIDAPGGGGKVPIIPNYIQKQNEEEVVLKNYLGNTHIYPQKKR